MGDFKPVILGQIRDVGNIFKEAPRSISSWTEVEDVAD
jgi:hypothetical protein